jgi:tetratricopeptide (TPR) repeat protein
VDPAEALAAAETAVRLGPDEVRTHAVHALALHGLGRHRAAVAAAETAVALDPEEPLTHEVLADARRASGDYSRAREAAITARELESDDARPHHLLGDNNLGVALQAQKRDAEAREVFERAVRADPRAEVTRENLARIARGPVNGVLMFIVWILAIHAFFAFLEGKDASSALLIPPLLVVMFVVHWVSLSERRPTLSPGVQRLLDDQPWYEKLDPGWRPWFWFIPAYLWLICSAGGLIGIAVAAANSNAARWGWDVPLLAAVFAALTGVFGYYTFRGSRR